MLTHENRAENLKTNNVLSIILFPIIAIAIAAISMLLFRNDVDIDSFWHRSLYFWHRLVWFEVITAFGCYGIFSGVLPQLLNKRQQTGAGYIGMAGALTQAVFLSYILWFVSLWLPTERLYFSIEISCQIVVVVVLLIKFFLLSTAQRLQNNGMELLPQNVRTPDDLCVFLELCEKQPSLEQNITWKIKTVREKIQYSIPRVGNIAQSNEYRSLSQKVQDFYDKMMMGNRDNLLGDLSEIDVKIQQVVFVCKK